MLHIYGPREDHLHDSKLVENFTKVNGVLHYLGFSSMNEEFPSGERPGIVHRLDVGTTGVIVVAKTVPWK